MPQEKAAPQKPGQAPAYAALVIAIIALVIACIGAFVLPTHEVATVSKAASARVVKAGSAEITIAADSTSGSVHILDSDSSYIVVATPAGKNAKYTDVTFNKGDGNLYLFASTKPKEDVTCTVNWVAYDASTILDE